MSEPEAAWRPAVCSRVEKRTNNNRRIANNILLSAASCLELLQTSNVVWTTVVYSFRSTTMSLKILCFIFYEGSLRTFGRTWSQGPVEAWRILKLPEVARCCQIHQSLQSSEAHWNAGRCRYGHYCGHLRWHSLPQTRQAMGPICRFEQLIKGPQKWHTTYSVP